MAALVALLVSLLGLILGVPAAQATETPILSSTPVSTSIVALVSTIQPVPTTAPAPSPPPVPPDDDHEPTTDHHQDEHQANPQRQEPSDGLLECLRHLRPSRTTTTTFAELCRKKHQGGPHRTQYRRSNGARDNDDADEEEQTFTTTIVATSTIDGEEQVEDLSELDLDAYELSGLPDLFDEEAWRNLADLADRHADTMPDDLFAPAEAQTITTTATTTIGDWLPGGAALLDLPDLNLEPNVNELLRVLESTEHLLYSNYTPTAPANVSSSQEALEDYGDILRPLLEEIQAMHDEYASGVTDEQDEAIMRADLHGYCPDNANANADDTADVCQSDAEALVAELERDFWVHTLAELTYGRVDEVATLFFREDWRWIERMDLVSRLVMLEVLFPLQHSGKAW